MENKKIKKFMAGFCAVAMMSTMLAGCGAKEEQKAEEKPQAGAEADADATEGETSFEGRTVSVLIQQSRYYDGMAAMVDKLKEEEGITLDVQIVPDDNTDSVIKMQLNSGEAPDMIDYNIPNIYGIVNPSEYLADLSNESWVDRLVTEKLATYKDGNIYAFPLQSSSGVSGIMYNKDVFEKNGLKVPTTEDEFYEVCDKLKELGTTPVLLPSDSWVPQIWMSSGFALAAGDEETCKNISDSVFSNKSVWTDYPELVDVVDTYLGLFEKGYINDDYQTVSYDSVLESLANGDGAMMMGTSGILATAEGLFGDANLGLCNLPFDYNKNGMLISQQFSIGFAATKDSKNLDVVKHIFDLWSTPEYLDLWFADQAGFPAFEGVSGGDLNEDVVKLYEECAATNSTVGEMNNYWNPIEPLFKSTLWVYYLDAPAKGMTGEELLTLFHEDVAKYLKEMKYEGF